MASVPDTGALAHRGTRRLAWLRTIHPFAFFLGVALVFVICALAGPKPWDAEAAQRLAEGKPRPKDFAAQVFFWVALGNTLVAIVLALTARWWGRPLDFQGGQCPARKEARWMRPAFWSSLVLIAIAGLLVRLPLAQKSLWWDEIWTLKNAVSGYVTWRDDGSERFLKRDWARTFWHYSKPTNHVGFSVLSRLSLEAWRGFGGHSREDFNELAFRLPSVLAGVAAILLIGWIGRDLLGNLAGLTCALVLALHPWFIRYSVDGRAFGLTVCWTLLAWLALRCVLKDGSGWSWWIVYGTAIALVVWTFPYNAHVAAGLGASGAIGLAILKRGSDRWRCLARFVVANIFAAMVFLQLAGPWVPQALAWNDVQGSDMAGPVISQTLIRQGLIAIVGLPEDAGGPDTELPSFASIASEWPWIDSWACIALPALVVIGVAVFAGACVVPRHQNGASQPPIGLILTLGTLAGLASAIAVAVIKQHYFYERYVIFSLPAFVFCIAAVFSAIARLGSGIRGRVLVSAPGAVCLGLFLLTTHPQRQVLLNRPMAPIRDVAYAVRAQTPAEGKGAWIGYGLGGDTPAIYFPLIRNAFTPDELLALLEEVRTSGRSAVLFYGHESFNRAHSRRNAQDAFRWLDDPKLFEPIAEFGGIDQESRYQIFRYTGVDPLAVVR